MIWITYQIELFNLVKWTLIYMHTFGCINELYLCWFCDYDEMPLVYYYYTHTDHTI